MKSKLLLTLLVVVVAAFLAGCKAPDQIQADKKDATDKMNKKAGGDD